MKTLTIVHPFLTIHELWPAPTQGRESSIPIKPEPPKPQDGPGEPEREHPLWTCFIENPRPKS